MSEALIVHVRYTAPYTARAVDAVLDAVAGAVARSWALCPRRLWVGPPPARPGWPVPSDPSYPPPTPSVYVEFSPTSGFGADLYFRRGPDGRLGVSVAVTDTVLYERWGHFEAQDVREALGKEGLDDDAWDALSRRLDEIEEADPDGEAARQNVSALGRLVEAVWGAHPVAAFEANERVTDPAGQLPAPLVRWRDASTPLSD